MTVRKRSLFTLLVSLIAGGLACSSPSEQASNANMSPVVASGNLYTPGTDVKLVIPGQSSVFIAQDENSFKRLMGALAATDSGEGLENLVQSGKVFQVSSNTKARILEAVYPRIRVRVIEGDKIMQEGWVSDRWLQ